MNTKEAVKKWKATSEKWVSERCREGLIPSAQKKGRRWEIPDEAEKPPCTRAGAVTILENLLERQAGNRVRIYTPSMESTGKATIKYLLDNGFIGLPERQTQMPKKIYIVLNRGIELISKHKGITIESIEKTTRISAHAEFGPVGASFDQSTVKRLN